ncbi:Uncharacterized protein APZ42_033498 [Daphnia magna]|uniref:Uncharacterized protein n=1 Tax=Daphnia magna TaxID=35525 RepID=A0A164L1D8_9CRUS|nr:Uncharacterized protein APZ42_033498 [Daphnia magna]
MLENIGVRKMNIDSKMCSFLKVSAKVIGVVAVGAGVVAVGWLGWKAYVKARAPVVQIADSDEAQADVVSADDNIVPPQVVEKPDAVPEAPAAKVRKAKRPSKALWNKSYQRRLAKRAQERAERAAQPQVTCEDAPHDSCSVPLASVQELCATDAISEVLVPADEEDTPNSEAHIPSRFAINLHRVMIR